MREKQKIERIISWLDHYFTKDFKEANCDNAIIGLSGGIDSALVFYLLGKILPQEKIFPVALPCHTFSKKKDLNSGLEGLNSLESVSLAAELVTAQKNPNFQVVDISENVQETWLLSDEVEFWEPTASLKDKLRFGNIAARFRMMTLFDLAAKNNGVVVGTENKTEKILGYYTLFGDNASIIEPIQHLYKREVVELAEYLDVPESIVKRPPSAELWAGQTDEGELGLDYRFIDSILMYMKEDEIKEIQNTNDLEKIVDRHEMDSGCNDSKEKQYNQYLKLFQRIRSQAFKENIPITFED